MLRQLLFAIVFSIGSVITARPPVALAAAPANDELATATLVSVLPFNQTISTVEATTGGDDPHCEGRGSSVWYRFTPSSNSQVIANTFGSDYNTTISVLRLESPSTALTLIACNDDWSGTQSRVQFSGIAGVTYYISRSRHPCLPPAARSC